MWPSTDFVAPILVRPTYSARMLSARDVLDDWYAVLSSIDVIHQVRGGTWPTSELSLEDDYIDLAWHQREFEAKYSYAYVAYSLENVYLGCLYIYPPDRPSSLRAPSSDDEATISWWVTTEAFNRGFYGEFSLDIRSWIETEWPFKKVNWANEVLSEEFNR